jgi:hypothetical protein
MTPLPNHIGIEECYAKVAECLALAEQSRSEGQKLMLLHIAETWERICSEIKEDVTN